MTLAEAKRGRPRSQVVFAKPLTGPSGATLTSYVWRWTLEEVVDKRGELVERRVSNWDASAENPATGREIVHQFEVDGRLLSAESALKALGYMPGSSKPFKAVKSAAQTLAKLLMAQAQLASDRLRWAQDFTEVSALPMPEITVTEWEQCDGYRKREWRAGQARYPQIHNELGCESDAEIIASLRRMFERNQMDQRGWSYCYQDSRGSSYFDSEAASLEKRIARAEAKLQNL